MWLEDLLSLLLYAPLLLPVGLLFIYAFARPRGVKTVGFEAAEEAAGPRSQPDH